MTYVIATDTRKTNQPPTRFWSRTFGAYQPLDRATRYPDFDAAQPMVRELRLSYPFVCAVEVQS